MDINQLIEQAKFCPQKLYQFALIIDNHTSINHTVTVINKNDIMVSSLNGYFSKS